MMATDGWRIAMTKNDLRTMTGEELLALRVLKLVENDAVIDRELDRRACEGMELAQRIASSQRNHPQAA